MIVTLPARLAVVAATSSVTVALVFSACGGGGDTKALQDQGAKLQQQGQQVRDHAQQIAADIKSGKITAEEGQKQLEAETAKLQNQVGKTADKALDAAKDKVPDSAKGQLEDAQKQLDAATQAP